MAYKCDECGKVFPLFNYLKLHTCKPKPKVPTDPAQQLELDLPQPGNKESK